MSVNIKLTFTIRAFDPARTEALVQAAHEMLVVREDLGAFGLEVKVAEGGRCILARTAWPAVISSSYVWIPKVTAAWKELANRVNGGPCEAELIEGNLPKPPPTVESAAQPDAPGAPSILPGVSLAGVPLGATVEALHAALGQEDVKNRYGGYSYLGLGMHFNFEKVPVAGKKKEPRLTSAVAQFAAQANGFARYLGRTPEGIGYDSTYEDLVAAYGEPIARKNYDWADIYTFACGLQANLKDGVLNLVTVKAPA